MNELKDKSSNDLFENLTTLMPIPTTSPESPKNFMVIDNWTTFKWMADGFVSWFILQHDNTRCYKPFVTVMKFEKTISVRY